jgi:hypothetical protein
MIFTSFLYRSSYGRETGSPQGIWIPWGLHMGTFRDLSFIIFSRRAKIRFLSLQGYGGKQLLKILLSSLIVKGKIALSPSSA